MKSRDVPQGDERDDKSKAKNRPARSQDPEEIPKGVDKPTDKLHSKSARDEQQPNKQGDEQSDVGKDGDTKRTQDKNSRLSQDGTDKAGAKELTTKQDPAAKNGREQPADQASGQQQGKSDKAPKSGDAAKSGQPEKGGAAKPGQQPQNGKASPDSQQQKDGQPADGQAKQSSQSGQKGEGKPGEPGSSPSKSDKGGDKPSKGGSSAAGMGNGKGTNNGGGGHNNGNGSGDGEGLVNTEKQANVDYARKATDLMLNRSAGPAQSRQDGRKAAQRTWAGRRMKCGGSSTACGGSCRASKGQLPRRRSPPPAAVGDAQESRPATRAQVPLGQRSAKSRRRRNRRPPLNPAGRVQRAIRRLHAQRESIDDGAAREEVIATREK